MQPCQVFLPLQLVFLVREPNVSIQQNVPIYVMAGSSCSISLNAHVVERTTTGR